ncbi:guanitoxin biosynthesis L-enduracididine beta-hydroxylase GntD [Streptomyces anulatus]|uniref:guanitoxin biosynthesis L-enduracididine beta-hydroxylase GntD n=1 Tax=Streptomyces anulatus TaxID=1892 RepID=UPI003864F1EC|nr:TauD/TfdA family dioxygenase [Streptomyces anulatus]
MQSIELSDIELKTVNELLASLTAKFHSVSDPEFVRQCAVYAHDLPQRLRAELNAFRLEASGGVLSIRGFRIDDVAVGPTPEHWRTHVGQASTLPAEVYFMLCASLLGDPIAWATQQDGRIMHDIFPIKGHEHEQLGSGSEELLTWHTEEAFHPLRADYLGLACLRNHDRVATNFASVDDLELTAEIRDLLGEERYPIKPDRSHLPHHGEDNREMSTRERELLSRSYEWIMAKENKPDRVAILFGDRGAPYLRIDPFFMEDAYAVPDGARAMKAIVAEIDRNIREHVLEPGELLFLDNYKIVHGRVPFTARFDGTDRWLKRLNVARDLRKSRDRRISHDARVIH